MFSVRIRVIVAVVGLTLVALLASGLVIYLRGNAAIEDRVAADQDREVSRLELLVTGGDPSTGQPFASTDALLREAVRQAVLAPSEGVVGVVAGAPRWLARDAVPLRPEDDPELLEAVLPLAAGDTIASGRLTTSTGDYRYTVAPVRLGSRSGSDALVVVSDLRGEGALLTDVYTTYVLVAAAAVLGVGVLIWVLVGRLLEPIRTMNRTAARITETDLSQRVPVRGRDDLSGLATTINGMLDRLQRAVDDQRELLDDVGHELRTPLTIVRGHLELLDVDDPAEVAATRDLVLDETGRMRRLVDDLLTLAGAEQPDFVVPAPCDVGRLTDEAVTKAAALGERHWVLENLADVEAVLDAQRITQAWLQLAANAVQYSEDGTTVAMGSRAAGDELELWVADEGVGMDAGDLDVVVQRHARGSSAGHRGGTGLGLAIVHAITVAHGGRIALTSVPDGGTRVAMVLPLIVPKEGR